MKMDQATTITGSATARLMDALSASFLLLPRTLMWIMSYMGFIWLVFQVVNYPHSLNYMLNNPLGEIGNFIWWILRWCLFYVVFVFVVQIVIWFRNSKQSRERHYEFNAEQFTMTDGTGIRTVIPWTAIRGGHKNRRILMLRYSQRAFAYIILRAFSEKDLITLIEFASANQK